MNETTKMPKEANSDAIAACTAPGEAVPMSFAQQQLWFLQNLDPQLTAYNLPRVFRMKGALDADALERAFQALVERHAVLRTRFFIRDGAALQTVQAEAAFGIERIDLRREAPASREEKLGDVVRRTVSHVFDLDVAPALVARLVRLADDEHVLAICLHHIVSDAWSNPILAKDLADAYAAALHAPGAVHLPALPLQYVDYARWQRERVASGSMQRDLDHWNAHLGPEVPALELPTDHARPEQLGFDGAATHFALEAPLCEALLKFCRAERSTPFVVMFAAWQVVLARYSGQYDFAVGVPSAGRHREELHGMLGFFVTTQVFRARLTPQMSLREACRQVRGDVLAALDHADLPFDVLLASRTDRREAGRTPLFQVMFGLQMEDGASGPVFEGLQVEQLPAPDRSAKFELSLDVVIAGAQVRGRLEYNTSLYDKATIERMAGAYLEVLRHVAADTDRPAGSFALTDAADRQRLAQWEGRTREHHAVEPIHRLFERQALARPDATALAFGEQVLSYGELNARANRLAHHLLARGVKPETLVGIAVERSADTVVGLLAILKAGAAYLPLDPDYPRDRLAYMIEDSGTALVLTQHAVREKIPASGSVAVLELDTLDLSAEPARDPNVGVGLENLAYVIYTSGSTGRPKGAQLCHRNVTRLLAATDAWLGFGPDDVWTLFHSYAFDFSVWEIFGALCTGGKLVVVPYWVSRSPEDFLALLGRERVTVLNQTPSAFGQLTRLAGLANAGLALRCVIFGGEALEPETLRSWMDRFGDAQPRLINMYGITETTVHVTYRPITRHDLDGGRSPIGVPIPDLGLRVLDGELNATPIGVPGELYVAGEGLARGYLGRPGLSAERFIADPFDTQGGGRLYRTGDLARWNEKGQLEYLGRIDHQVKVRGFRIELGEIEAQLLALPEVREAAVIAKDNASGTWLAAYVSATDGQALEPARLREQLGRQLPDYMVPSVVVALEALPLNANGKVDRKALPEPAFAASEAYEAPQGETEQVLAVIWAEVLGVERVGRNDNFFELGGHSLMALGLLERIRARGWTVQVRTLFQWPQLARFAQAVEQEQLQARREVVVPVNGIAEGCTFLRPEMITLMTLDAPQLRRIEAAVPGGAANIQDVYPLVPLQEGMLFHHLLQTEGDAYVTSSMLGFDSRERLERFVESFNEVIGRHDILRTAVMWEELAEPVQVVFRHAPMQLQWLDDAALPEGAAARWSAAERLAHHAAPERYRIDVRRAPMIQAVAVHDPEQQQWLLQLLNHHLVDDNTTLKLVVKEIALIQHGRRGELPVPVPFRQFVAQAKGGMSRAEHEAFFGKLLGDVTETTAPFGLLDVQGDGSTAESVRLPLDPVLAQKVREQVQRHGVSAATLFHLAWGLVVARASARDDVVFGTVLFGRMQGGESALGLFINTLPLRLTLGAQTVEECLRQTHAMLSGLLHHEHASLSLAQRCSGMPGGAPLFTSLLNCRHAAPRTSEVSEEWAGVEMIGSRERSNYPLAMSVDDMGSGFEIGAQVTATIGARRVCGFMQEAVRALVTALAAHPSQRMSELDVMTGDEKALLRQWGVNPDGVVEEVGATGEAQTVIGAFERQARTYPDATALLFDEQVLSYGELNERANRLSHRLIALGVRAETKVGIAVERSVEMMVGLLAILKAGAAYVPLDPEYPEQRLAYMLEDSGVALLLTQGRIRSRVPGSEALTVLEIDTLDVGGEPGHDPRVPLHGENLAYVIYTSGSTGKPKGAAVRHGSLFSCMRWMQDTYHLTQADTVLHKAPFGFDVSVWEMFWPLTSGVRLVVARPDDHRDPERLVQLIQRHQITTLNFVPSMLQAFLAHDGIEASTRLRHIICGGEAMPAATQKEALERLHGAGLQNLYGPTETTIHVTHWACRNDGQNQVPIGRPISQTQTYVLDAGLNLVPQGVAGELYLGGISLARGYLNRAGLTAERFVADPFDPQGGRLYRTGDLVRWSAEGQIEYLGRIDHQVKIRGLRIELGEVEAQLLAQPGVRETVVVAREGQGGTRLVGYVGSADAIDVVQIRAALGRVLPDYMVPAAIVAMGKLPLNANGKIDRKALPEPELAGAEGAYEAPEGSIEAALARCWVEVLGVARVGRHDNFFELGGDSILSLQIVVRMRKAGWRITPRQLFERQTVAQLAAVAETLQDAPRRLASQLEGDVPLLPIQAEFLGKGLAVPSHWNQAILLQPRRRIDLTVLRRALEAVVTHHDAFRLRFTPGAGGEWTQRYEDDSANHLQELLWVRKARDGAQIEALCDEAQRSLDIERGVLLRALAIEVEDGSQRLLLAINHLAIDGVSWRILLEDLGAAYEAGAQGVNIALPEKTSSYKDWALALQSHAEQLLSSETELAHWQSMAGVPAELPCERPHGAANVAEQAEVELRLDRAATDALLRDAPAAYRTQVNDILLTALGRALCAWSGQSRILVDLEGHGREDLFDGIDLTRTVGWFTSAYPVALAPLGELGEALKRVKESLRGIPGKGLGFGLLHQRDASRMAVLPKAQVVFNYLGQFDGEFDEQAPWAPAAEGMGVTVNASAPLGHEFLVNGQVYAGELALRVMYSKARHDAASVRQWVEGFRQELLALVAHCTSGLAQAQGVTPSDFPLVSTMPMPTLDALLSRLPAVASEIENIYPLTPGQQGMLVECTIAPATEVDVVQTLVQMQDLDLAKLRAAWQATVARHAVLRTGFHWLPDAEPVQVVLRQAEAAIESLDWRGLHADEAAQESAWEALCELERRRGFDMERPPLARWTVVRVDERAYRLAWTWHHVLFDGWSGSRVTGELFAFYAGERVTSALQPYADFVGAVRAARHAGSAEVAYWRGRYEDIGCAPTLLSDVPMQQWSRHGCNSTKARIGADTVRALRAIAQAEQVTMNTLMQAVWSVLLMQSTGREAACFGVTMSGRSLEMRGIDDVVGLCMNSLPLMLHPERVLGVGAWLRQIVSANLELRQREHASLPAIQGWLGRPGQPLYDSLVIFENYPIDEAVARGAGARLGIRASSDRGILGVPLLLIVEIKGDELLLTLEYARDVFDDDGMVAFAERMCIVLDVLREGVDGTVASLLDAIPTARLELLKPRAPASINPSVPVDAQVDVLLTSMGELWQGLLADAGEPGLPVSMLYDRNFFELGGDSLLAARLVLQWNACAGREGMQVRKMWLVDVFEQPVMRELVAALHG
ncbi:non-ribosomal peptide synthetase [Variovorax boronicumulans]|uniref:non-ribosomal peptide synthetase n=1 Tax=Variovorax boronicumulans TaxID=436515 RepID=UPI00278A13C8|nr:non-ribosomal peptide synthetase [Variovorax boronicumulans]MDQ0045096.1 amino acid adenylation domain-containing protein/non-ribosomal peptide synthase protein (TIGR01720 family) [Variovorax boronicumulans]